MAAPPSAPPPTYNESMQQSSVPPYLPQPYGANPGAYPPQQGGMPPYQTAGQQNPYTTGSYDPSKQGAYPPPHNPYPPTQNPYPGQGMPPQTGVTGSYQSSVIVQPTQQVVMVGGCPACRVGVLDDDFTCCGVLLAILFFPIGLLCCLAMRQRRCTHCGAVFG